MAHRRYRKRRRQHDGLTIHLIKAGFLTGFYFSSVFVVYKFKCFSIKSTKTETIISKNE